MLLLFFLSDATAKIAPMSLQIWIVQLSLIVQYYLKAYIYNKVG